MSSDKKITKEDTWKPAELRKHIREGGHVDNNVRRRDDSERRQRGGESVERTRRDPEKETRREKDKLRERRDKEEIDKYADRRKEGSRDRRSERDRKEETRRDKVVDGKRYDEDKERHRDKEDMDKRREDRDKEKRREERDERKEKERWRHEEGGEGETERREKQDREKRDRHRERDKDEDKRNDRERRERKHVEVKEDGENRDEQRRRREERERRHKERGNHDEKRKHDSRSREHRDVKEVVEEVRGHGGDRERTERDKNKERKHREDEEPERNHRRDPTSSRKSDKASDKSHDAKTEDKAAVRDLRATAEPAAKDEDLADYEDDFEDYEEDFEELDESPDEEEEEEKKEGSEVLEEKEELTAERRKEIEAIQRAMDEENQRVQSREISSTEEERPRWSRGSEKTPSVDSQRGKFIDFVAAKQREVSKKVASKQKKRSTELLRLIDLDFSTTASLLDLPPVNEYDMYIRTFGTANTKQAYVQCNEDNVDRDIQTEETEVCEKWTQHPPEHNGACGDPNLSREAQDKSKMSFDSRRLTAFLRSASQVMVVLLEEHRADRKSLEKMKSPTDSTSFSDGSLLLNTKLPFLYGRSVSLLHFSPAQKHTVMSVHRPTETPSAVRLDSCSIICIWNIWEPSSPQRVLIYESEVQCCCFSPGKAVLVFAGTSVGSVLLWDLRENTEDHYSLKIGEEEWTFRQPTFSTDAVMSGSGHFSSVTSVEVVPSSSSSDVPLLASEEESSGLSFQLASLDEVGVLNFWVVLELPKANEAGSPTDLGLRPGGKVKLLHSSVLLTAERESQRDAAKTGPLQTLNLKFLPTDSNHFFIGTNMGLVNHETSHGLKVPPRFYRFQEAGVQPVDVTSIHFSPFRKHLFLVGCGDGSIRLHAVSQQHPVSEWRNSTSGEPVISLQWNQTRPSVFCVLDGASNLHIWDLLRNDTQPVVTEKLHSDRVTAMSVFGDSGQQHTYSGVALAHESGKIEMQYFTRSLTVSSSEEEEKLESLVTEAF
ncbi:WD repeat-containing protein 60 isoform X2 [Trematomus bernacchii]|uniref:WD repeat-containing protein 60 isoform X2 n=1 Tax=Trematomus bernacchii TaxID=40690 RepID=UPI00146B112F|nr:WD repeat-containing protein 60 isoform X2 [Trematomus bernacchii]